MHLLGSALLRGDLHRSQFQAKWSNWLWDYLWLVSPGWTFGNILWNTLPKCIYSKDLNFHRSPQALSSNPHSCVAVARKKIWNEINPFVKSMAKLLTCVFFTEEPMLRVWKQRPATAATTKDPWREEREETKGKVELFLGDCLNNYIHSAMSALMYRNT